jgi:hypothetical protein
MTDDNKLFEYLGSIYTNIKTDVKDMIFGEWEDDEYCHYLLRCDEDGAFYIPVINHSLERYDGDYYVIHNFGNYYIFSRRDMDEAIVLDHLYETVFIDKEEYEKVYLNDIIDRVRKVI